MFDIDFVSDEEIEWLDTNWLYYKAVISSKTDNLVYVSVPPNDYQYVEESWFWLKKLYMWTDVKSFWEYLHSEYWYDIEYVDMIPLISEYSEAEHLDNKRLETYNINQNLKVAAEYAWTHWNNARLTMKDFIVLAFMVLENKHSQKNFHINEIMNTIIMVLKSSKFHVRLSDQKSKNKLYSSFRDLLLFDMVKEDEAYKLWQSEFSLNHDNRNITNLRIELRSIG